VGSPSTPECLCQGKQTIPHRGKCVTCCGIPLQTAQHCNTWTIGAFSNGFVNYSSYLVLAHPMDSPVGCGRAIFFSTVQKIFNSHMWGLCVMFYKKLTEKAHCVLHFFNKVWIPSINNPIHNVNRMNQFQPKLNWTRSVHFYRKQKLYTNLNSKWWVKPSAGGCCKTVPEGLVLSTPVYLVFSKC
jgi:hypothetical protein